MAFLNIKLRVGEREDYVIAEMLDMLSSTDYDVEEIKWDDDTSNVVSGPAAIAQSIRGEINRQQTGRH